MSAYVVSDETIDTIVSFVMRNPNALLNTPYFYHSGMRLGETLARENRRSVIYRYLHNAAIVKETKAIPRYVFNEPAIMPHVSQVIAALTELDYQSCECPDYESTDAAKIWRAIARYAVNFSNELEKV